MSLTKAPSITPLLSYYRNSLADADRMAPEDSLIQNGILTDDDAWLTGQLHREQADHSGPLEIPMARSKWTTWDANVIGIALGSGP